ncbi:tripartite tricarboxylate transporter substrate binding protein [Cryobacterium sp. Y57]|uniref:Bug family tripartite tricarboxylate transporter substrate binding protein n=1 Tax=Cryobacterium sp. Y57 TaxID=2048287 RepID=UPI000CE4AC4A|nr:tripartite tricarboxylate transporter substrate-binding protein [Cryobacterium sp. Y57]
MENETPTGRAHPWRGLVGVSVLACAIVAALITTDIARSSAPASAIQAALGGQQLRIMAPANPGGGWDQTSRALQVALGDIAGRSEVYNVGGAGGTPGLAQFVQHEGDASQLMTTGAIMVGAIITNDSPFSLGDTTLLARLTTEYLVVVVPASSEIMSLADLTELMESDVAAQSISGGSAGGVEQILAGMYAQAIGADPAEVSYVAHSGGGEALTTLLSARSTAGISGISEIAPYIADGSVRALAVSSPGRVPTLPDVPTFIEQDVAIELQNWRGIVAPPGISEADRKALVDLLTEMHGTDQWQEIVATRGWGDEFLTGDEFDEFVRVQEQDIRGVLEDIGLVS